jgi:ubiquitin-conjugating enzyme E2 J1
MSKSPSLRRIQADIRELARDPSDRYFAAPLENDMFEWHFTIRGADGTDFEGGVYHGRILVCLNFVQIHSVNQLVRCI